MVVASRHNGSGLRAVLVIGANIMMGLQPPWVTIVITTTILGPVLAGELLQRNRFTLLAVY